MSRGFSTVRPICFLIFIVLAKSQFGLGQEIDYDVEENQGEDANVPQSFTAVSSLFFEPGTDYNVFFSANPHSSTEPLKLKCLLMANSSEAILITSDSISLLPGESGNISIPLPRETVGAETILRLFTWHFKNGSIEDKGYIDHAPHTLIVSSELPNSERASLTKVNLTAVFIQTDKPAYKPDDLVRIRVITMGSDGRPHLTAGVNLTISDSKKNVMKKWEQPIELPTSASTPSNVSTIRNGGVALFGEFQKKKNGLSAYEYQLSSEPILGNWTIEMQAGNITEKMYFDVKKYILPKFQVKIHVPSVLYGTGDISTAAKIKVTYTFGKDLQGAGNVTVTSHVVYNSVSYPIGSQTQQQFTLTKNGEAVVPLKLSSSSGYESSLHTITANVTEKNTGRWQIGTTTVRIYPQEKYKIDWINQPGSYKPGLPMTVQLKITDQDGFPVKEVRSNALKITFLHPLTLTAKETSIPLSGIVTFNFTIPLQSLSANPTFQIQYKSSTIVFPLPTVQKATSSGIYIDVIPPPDSVHLIQGNSYIFTIHSNKKIKPKRFHCLLWDDAAMDVHGSQVIKNTNEEAATDFPFSLQLPKGAYTNLKVYVYFEKKEEGKGTIISAFKSINTHNYLKIRVSRPPPIVVPTTPAPEINNPGEVAVAEASSTVAPTADAPAETTTEEYELYPDDMPSDDPAAAEPQPQPKPQPLMSNKLEVQPGDAVEIHFETYPDSTIAIRGIDQSLLLLTEQDNDLDAEKIKNNRLTSPVRPSNLEKLPTDNATFLNTFRTLGIAILSSERFIPFAGHGATSPDEDPDEDDVAPSDNAVVDAKNVPVVDTRLRTKFPETWLWEEFQSSNDSSVTVLSKTLPDTLTSWIISGFSLNPKTGLGVASPATITGFKQFFVTLNLPYSVMKLETFDLQVIVHNYLDRDVKVYVTLSSGGSTSDFDFEDGRMQQNRNGTRYIKVDKNDVVVVHFLITPLVLGDIPIEVKAVTEDGTAADWMIRPLKVKPDGVRESRSQLVLFETKTGDKNLTREASFNVEFPNGVVKGANSLQLTVVGDPIGTMVANLGHLLRLPGGCGEQNMIRLVPNILALRYLSAINSDDQTTIQTAKTNLETGYCNQLPYQKADGSFAVYTKNAGSTYKADQKGSIWLTAYVLQWFAVAQKHITIDGNVIKKATKFIRDDQNSDGSFVEKGDFYHPEMRGRTGSAGVALTAYITLALIKVNEKNTNDDLKLAIQDGMRFISRASTLQLDDNYITNLVTATLVAGNHAEKDRFLKKMETGANSTTGKDGVNLKFWNMVTKREQATGPLAIEMTSYALLAHLWKGGKIDVSVLQIYRWLLDQRNPQGGFISTQDTAIGLTALTEFALKNVGNVRDEDELQLDIKASSGSSSLNDTLLSLSIARWNRMVLQEFTIPPTTKKVNIQAKGVAPGLVQMTEIWHMPIKSRPPRQAEDDFNLTASMTIPHPDDPTETNLTVCVNSFHLSGAKDSIASIELPSGYAFYLEDYEKDTEFMASRPENTNKFELKEGNTKMDIYYSSIPAHPPTCVSLVATQQIKVANAQKPSIFVYEYLNPARKGKNVYVPAHLITKCQLCQEIGSCEECD